MCVRRKEGAEPANADIVVVEVWADGECYAPVTVTREAAEAESGQGDSFT